MTPVRQLADFKGSSSWINIFSPQSGVPLDKRLLSGIIALFFLFLSADAMALEIKSDSFRNAGYIPSKYTCDSDNISPRLKWSDIPSGTKSFVLICDDPDAPFKRWTHWVVFNIPLHKTGLSLNIPRKRIFADRMAQGINDFGRIGYDGPCPPPGKAHRYFFRLYALDSELDLDGGPTKQEVLRLSKGHVISEAQIFGLYQR